MRNIAAEERLITCVKQIKPEHITLVLKKITSTIIKEENYNPNYRYSDKDGNRVSFTLDEETGQYKYKGLKKFSLQGAKDWILNQQYSFKNNPRQNYWHEKYVFNRFICYALLDFLYYPNPKDWTRITENHGNGLKTYHNRAYKIDHHEVIIAVQQAIRRSEQWEITGLPVKWLGIGYSNKNGEILKVRE